MRLWVVVGIVFALVVLYNVRMEQLRRRRPQPAPRPSTGYRRRRRTRPRKPQPGAKTKVCAGCGKRRYRENFADDRRTVDGLDRRCKFCHIDERVAKLPEDQQDAERRRLTGRSRPTDGMTPDETREYQRVRSNRYQREWQRRHPGYSTDITRRWRASHPAEYAAKKAKERGATEIEIVPPLEIFQRDGWICHICGDDVEIGDASLDHVVPIALGGGHTRRNLACSHRSCNFAKREREPSLCPSCGELVMAGASRCRWCGFSVKQGQQ